MHFLLDKSDLGVYNRNIITERQTMFWFKLKNKLNLINSALWDNDEKLYTEFKNDPNFSKLKSEQDIERVVKYIKHQQDLSFRSQVSRR